MIKVPLENELGREGHEYGLGSWGWVCWKGNSRRTLKSLNSITGYNGITENSLKKKEKNIKGTWRQ